MALSALVAIAALLGAPAQRLPAVHGEGDGGQLAVSSPVEVDTRRPADLAIDPVRALSGVPGVVIADRRNEAQDPKLVVRGFGARSAFGIRGVRLEVDGIPATMPDGQGQLSHVPWSADAVVSIERGPLAVLAGASGALLRVQTLPELAPTAQAETVIAGGDRQRASAEIASVDDERSRYGGVSLLGYRNGGFRPHSRAERTQLGARWQQPGLGGSWQLVA
ncbi:MAG: TonB-dependent receptor plug domain-containing protein, partial [Xanthomonadales bacterium]|nr:TonB-dependent receptor plug domain-containing protein [Xanthomonadales bacterium]